MADGQDIDLIAAQSDEALGGQQRKKFDPLGIADYRRGWCRVLEVDGDEDAGEYFAAALGRSGELVARIKRDILARSSIGLITTHRDPSGLGPSNTAGGFDANFGFFQNVTLTTLYAKSTAPKVTGPRVRPSST